ncbi:hypothetical protein D9M68_660980 [compost metagenome]
MRLPVTVCGREARASRALRMATSIWCAWRRNWCPACVSDMPRARRSNSKVPRSASICAMAWDTTDCETPSSWMAAEMEPDSATAMKYRMLLNEVLIGSFRHFRHSFGPIKG